MHNTKLYEELSDSITEIIIGNTYKNIRMYGYLLLTIQKEFVSGNHPVQTAGIGLINDNYKLFINEDFWKSKINLSSEKKVFLLCHEIIHTIFNHPLHYKNSNEAKLYNEATDLYINSILLQEIGINSIPGCADTKDWQNIHKPKLQQLINEKQLGLIDEQTFNQEFEKIPIRGVHPDDYDDPEITIPNCIAKGSNWIYEKLYIYKKDENKCSGIGIYNDNSLNHPSDHNDWKDTFDDLSEGVKSFIENQENYIVKEVVDNLNSQQGNVPGYLKELLDKILNPKKPVFDYVGFIRNWVSTFGNYTEITHTKSKPNLLLDDVWRLKFKASKHILIALDTSGSMSTNNIREVLIELAGIQKVTKMKMDMCEVDASIHNVIPIDSVNDINDYITNMGITGRGGKNLCHHI